MSIKEERTMYGTFSLLIVLAVWTDGFSLDDVQCNYMFRQCHTYENTSVINYCTTEDVPNEINFTVVWDENDRYSLKVAFAPPKGECRFGVALLVNPAVKDERECREHKFEKAKDINSTVHTVEKTLCVFRNDHFVKNNDNSTVSACKDNIEQWYQYIFAGCYALRFHVGRQNYLIRGHKLLNTTYQPKEVMEPQFICKYNSYLNLERHELTNFTLSTSLPSDTGLLLKVAIVSEHNRSLENRCVWHREQLPIYTRTISLIKKSSNDHNCTIKWAYNSVHGEHIKTLQCNFQVQTKQVADYCFVFRVTDDRCHKNTFWTPPNINGMTPCTWIKRCARTLENSAFVENTNIKSDKLLSASSYLLLPIITAVLVVLMIGTLCFLHYLRIRKEEMNLYMNPEHDDFMNPACLKPADFTIVDNGNDSDKRIHHDNFTCDDIILVYTKNSTSFMALMKDFRETLAKICSCYVHDWHDGAEWNDVAKVGAVLWFTELMNCGCRVVWIDTPATRSVVTSNFKKNGLTLNKLNGYEIGDFRDVAFPVALELAKRNTKDAVYQYRRHFIVRFEGLECAANMHDPFLDLSPHARYRMPQHLAQLCSDMSLIKPMIPNCQMKAEENLLQQRLKFMKMESVT